MNIINAITARLTDFKVPFSTSCGTIIWPIETLNVWKSHGFSSQKVGNYALSLSLSLITIITLCLICVNNLLLGVVILQSLYYYHYLLVVIDMFSIAIGTIETIQ